MSAPLFKQNDAVLDRARSYGVGIVLQEPELDGGDWWYVVRFEGGREESLPEHHLELRQQSDTTVKGLALAGRFGTLESFRRAMSVERIRRDQNNRTTVYSLNAQRIQFQPHQYKPLLRFLDSEDRRLMIADEVGLGKTIEAGIILAEMEARSGPEKVLVVCPSKLREKWWEEFSRKFDQEFEIWGSSEVNAYARRVAQSPHKARMRAILSMESLRRPGVAAQLIAATTQVDLLIVDEAHHARNSDSDTSAAISDVAAAAAAVLFLTATPIHLKNENLFNQLRMLRPDEFSGLHSFEFALQRNEGVLQAMAKLRTRDPVRLEQAARDIERSFSPTLLGGGMPAVALQCIKRLRESAPASTREWIELEHDVERLHFLANILTRTRKVDVVEFRAKRVAEVLRVQWSQQERELYNSVTGLLGDNGWPTHSFNFGEIQRARMAASSLPGLLFFRDADADDSVEQDLGMFDVADGNEAAADAATAPGVRFESIRDSKFDRLMGALEDLRRNDPQAKVLIFTQFRGTSRYLTHALKQRGWNTLRIAGDITSDPRNPERDLRGQAYNRFRDDAAVSVLVSTEVGSEGLDFQFCHVVVNYDLPWNPMVVEQRIGRIDRFGQKSEKLQIVSMVIEGTIEDRILMRLYERIGLFERSLGAMEMILGQEVERLGQDFFERKLSPAQLEARLQQTEIAIENKRALLEDLEKQSQRFFGQQDYIQAEMNRVRKLGRYVTPQSLLTVIGGFLDRKHPNIRIKEDRPGLYSIRLTNDLKQDVRARSALDSDAMGTLNRHTRDGSYLFAVDGPTAYDHDEYDLLNAAHPLVRVALEVLSDLLADPTNKVGSASLTLRGVSDAEIPTGEVYLSLYRLEVVSIRPRSMLETVAWSKSAGAAIDPEAAERLLHLVTTEGTDWSGQSIPPALPSEAWRAMESAVRARSQRMEAREKEDNQLLRQRRTELVEQEHRREREIIERSIATARERGNWTPNFQRMQEGRQERGEARKVQQLSALERGGHVIMSHSPEPLAFCIVDVKRT